MIHTGDFRYKIITPMAGKQMTRGFNYLGKTKGNAKPKARSKRGKK